MNLPQYLHSWTIQPELATPLTLCEQKLLCLTVDFQGKVRLFDSIVILSGGFFFYFWMRGK